jgi:hypothetical protein
MHGKHFILLMKTLFTRTMFSQLYLSHQKTIKKIIRNIEIFSQDLLIITKLMGTNKFFFILKAQ